MGKISTTVFRVLGAAAVAYVACRCIGSWNQGYSWTEMDWSQRGSTSIGDFFAASDIGKRKMQKNGIVCMEYFAYKDGLPIKTVCPP